MALRRPQRKTPLTGIEPTESPEFELPPIVELTLAESQAHFDALALELLGMSGAEFVARYESGEYDDVLDDEDHRHHLYLVMLGGLDRSVTTVTKSKMSPLVERRHKAAPADASPLEFDDYPLPPVRTMTLEEGQAFFDRQARELLGMSGEEFRKRYHAGRYDDILDDPDYSSLMYLAMLGAGPRANGEHHGT